MAHISTPLQSIFVRQMSMSYHLNLKLKVKRRAGHTVGAVVIKCETVRCKTSAEGWKYPGNLINSAVQFSQQRMIQFTQHIQSIEMCSL